MPRKNITLTAYISKGIITVNWIIRFHKDFEPEYDALPIEIQNEIYKNLILLERFGPMLGRPQVDTLKGSRHSNMKELRFNAAGGVWRIAFAFDPQRHALLLVGGDKSGTNEKRFYRKLIEKADKRFDDYLAKLRERMQSKWRQP